MIVFLEELVFALCCFVCDKLGVVPKLLPPLLFCHVAQPFGFQSFPFNPEIRHVMQYLWHWIFDILSIWCWWTHCSRSSRSRLIRFNSRSFQASYSTSSFSSSVLTSFNDGSSPSFTDVSFRMYSSTIWWHTCKSLLVWHCKAQKFFLTDSQIQELMCG